MVRSPLFFPLTMTGVRIAALTADVLDYFVDEVMDRTKLLPHYKRRRFGVDLVGHSMGGLIIADYLKRYGQRKKIRRVVSIGTPFEGAIGLKS
ncbi:MAG: alpha/beta fold hydrolase [Thermodesulfobacteriota bacterium]|nr:alpha/beta fold hydrolase [Thermodesulfobacteriota bacterium]